MWHRPKFNSKMNKLISTHLYNQSPVYYVWSLAACHRLLSMAVISQCHQMKHPKQPDNHMLTWVSLLSIHGFHWSYKQHNIITTNAHINIYTKSFWLFSTTCFSQPQPQGTRETTRNCQSNSARAVMTHAKCKKCFPSKPVQIATRIHHTSLA